MGVCLYFRTAESVPADVAEAIRNELARTNRSARWIYCEPLDLDQDAADGRLTGRTKLNLHPWPDEYTTAMREPAERGDFQTVLDALADWSGRYQLTWEVGVEGHPLGRVAGGECDPGLAEALEAMTAVADELAQFDPLTGEPAGDADRDAAGGDEPPGFRPRLFRPDGD